MSTQLERFQAISSAAAASFSANSLPETTPALLASLTVASGGQIDAPDENGDVKLTGLPDGNWWKDNVRLQIAEVSKSLTGDQGGKAIANLMHANGVWYGGLIAVCYQAVQVDDGFGGKRWAVTGTADILPNTRSLPSAVMYDGSDLGTIAGAIAWFTKLAPPGPRPEFPHP